MLCSLRDVSPRARLARALSLSLCFATAYLAGTQHVCAQPASGPAQPAGAADGQPGDGPQPASGNPAYGGAPAAAPAQQAAPAPAVGAPGYPGAVGPQPAPSPLYQQPAPLYQPPAGQPYASWQPPRPSRGMMITGISILSGSYLLATSVALGLLDDDDNDCKSCQDVAPWLFVPLAGPFIAMHHTDDGDWALWTLGMVEAVGTGLMIGGIIRYKRTLRAAEMQSFSSWSWPGGRSLSLSAATSARMVGPRLKLTF